MTYLRKYTIIITNNRQEGNVHFKYIIYLNNIPYHVTASIRPYWAIAVASAQEQEHKQEKDEL